MLETALVVAAVFVLEVVTGPRFHAPQTGLLTGAAMCFFAVFCAETPLWGAWLLSYAACIVTFLISVVSSSSVDAVRIWHHRRKRLPMARLHVRR